MTPARPQLPEIGAAKQKRVFAAYPEAFGEEWVTKAIKLLLRSHGRVVAAQVPHRCSDDLRPGVTDYTDAHRVAGNAQVEFVAALGSTRPLETACELRERNLRGRQDLPGYVERSTGHTTMIYAHGT